MVERGLEREAEARQAFGRGRGSTERRTRVLARGLRECPVTLHRYTTSGNEREATPPPRSPAVNSRKMRRRAAKCFGSSAKREEPRMWLECGGVGGGEEEKRQDEVGTG